jgi:NAD(P)-dependent dehydrogenase (short-subunit alcohol dehydrogenase family)
VSRWTTKDIPDLAGRIAVVTGANSGLGLEAATALARAGARVVLACRNGGKGAGALDRIRRDVPAGEVELHLLDLADLASVRRFAADFATEHEGLDILLNNAGVMAIPRVETEDGFEMQFGTNHLGHFALTGLLIDSLLARPSARVVTTSSHVARMGRIDFGDLHGSRRYRKWAAYSQSKLSNQLFTLELDRRARHHGLDLVSVAAHPGYAATGLQTVGARMRGSRYAEWIYELGNSILAQPAAEGALPILYAATAPVVRGGQYFGPDGRTGMRGYPKQVPFVRAATDPVTASQLWEESVRLTGVRFGPLQTGT